MSGAAVLIVSFTFFYSSLTPLFVVCLPCLSCLFFYANKLANWQATSKRTPGLRRKTMGPIVCKSTWLSLCHMVTHIHTETVDLREHTTHTSKVKVKRCRVSDRANCSVAASTSTSNSCAFH